MRHRLLRYWPHWLFFLCPCVAYLVLLFSGVFLQDTRSLFHDVVRVALAVFEIAAWGLLGMWLLRRWLTIRHFAWWLLYLLLAATVCLIYVAQIDSLWTSNNFVSVLAIQNARYIRFEISPLAITLIVAGLIWIALLGAYSWRAALGRQTPAPFFRRGLWRVAIGIAALVLYVGLVTQQRRYLALEPAFIQTPVASLVANAWATATGTPTVTTMSLATARECFNDPGAGQFPGYPFEKSRVYAKALPYAKTANAPLHPNVIIIFTEGTSARMLGAYGGKYPGLTPNLDVLAHRSIQVTDYYNHTAATYRGITGQTASGFTFANGNAWKQGNNAVLLTTVSRQTIATILNGRGYQSYFFEPEHHGAFTELLSTLGFSHIYGFGAIAKLLHGKERIQAGTAQVDDISLFTGMTNFLKQRAVSGNRAPFLIGAYNIGTHAFIPMAADGKPYGTGTSQMLNKWHTYDEAIGGFLDWFYTSPYAHNTIVVFTTDHATYPDRAYREVAGADLQPYFVDKIPLLIYDPTHRLPKTLYADGRNSLDLAPTLLQLLGMQDAPNSFLGTSLFEPRRFPLGITAIGANFYITTSDGLYAYAQAPAAIRTIAKCEHNVVNAYYAAERADRIFDGPAIRTVPAAPGITSARHLCALDIVNGQSPRTGQVKLRIGHKATFGGWFSSAAHHPVATFAIHLEGDNTRYAFEGRDSVARPDVARKLGFAGDDTYGFNASTDFSGAVPGHYRVKFIGPNQDTCEPGRQIQLMR